MSSTFKYHSQVDEIVPWQATYTFPSQATKVNKQTVKLVPKNGSTFRSGNIIRIEFPADNYLNVLNSVLQFDTQFEITNSNSGGVVHGLATAHNSSGEDVNTTGMVVFDNFVAGSGSAAIGTTNGQQIYNGYLIAITDGTGGSAGTVGGTFYSVVSSSFYASSGTTYGFRLMRPLPIALTNDKTYHITLIPPYCLQRGGAQNFIKRLRILYGSLVLEDIQEYKTLVRMFFEAAVDPGMAAGSGAILEGLQGAYPSDAVATSDIVEALQHAFAQPDGSYNSERYLNAGGPSPSNVQSILQCAPALSSIGAVVSLGSAANYPNTGRTTYCLNLLSGIFTQKKLIPLKWMAAQLAIEITLASEADCLLTNSASNSITYELSNVNFLAEMLEFDSAYDQAFLAGLRSSGVPIKFSSFHYHSHSVSGTYNVFQIHERARSVKAAYAIFRDTSTLSTLHDSDRFFFSLAETWSSGLLSSKPGRGQIQQYQWRIGGRYYPAQPIRTVYGASEAFVELQKALDTLGDYTRQAGLSPREWSVNNGGHGSKFIMAAPFENQDVFPETISGINAEEQSDIALFVNSDSADQPTSKRLEVFMHYDALMIVMDGNVVNLVL
jgi:hypothetical protein